MEIGQRVFRHRCDPTSSMSSNLCSSSVSYLPLSSLAKKSGINEGAAMWLFQFSVNFCSTAALNARLRLKRTSLFYTPWSKEGMLKTYNKAVKYLFQTYITDDFIAKIDASLTRYTRPSTMSPTYYAKDLAVKLLRCGEVCSKYVLSGVFIKHPHKSLRQSSPSFSTTHPVSPL